MTNAQIGQLLKDNRVRKKYTQQEVAEKMSASGEYKMMRHHLVHYEQGKMNFTIKFINEYLSAINCEFDLKIKDKK